VISRRAFLASVAAVLLGGCGSSDARKRIAFVEAGSESANAHFVEAFRKGLREMGYEDGRNVTVDVRWAEGRMERFSPLLAVETLPRSEALSKRYGPGDGRLFLVRPDGYIGFKCRAAENHLLQEALERVLTR